MVTASGRSRPSLAVERQKNCMPGRYLPAFGLSAIAHAAVFLLLTLTIHRVVERRYLPGPAADGDAVYDAPGLAGESRVTAEAGGGGNQMRESPRRIQRPGRDAVSVPPVRTPIPVRPVPEPAEPVREQTIAAPVLPLASAAHALPGALDDPSLTTMSLGPGGPDGAGSGAPRHRRRPRERVRARPL